MKRPRTGSTPKQFAYAVKKLNGDGPSKKAIALSVGFSPTVANNAKNKIEKTEGYQNAVIELAAESNNMVMAVMAEYKARGLKNFSNKDLNGAMNAIAQAWEKFNKHRAPNGSLQPENPIKRAIFQKIENQTINVQSKEVPVTDEPATASDPKEFKPEGPGLDLDF